jgi:thiamine kinase-like enzyme
VPLDEIIAAVPELREPRSVERIPGGLTNENYKVETGAGTYVVRMFGKETGLLAIDRGNEAHNSMAAAEVGVGAPVIAYVAEPGALVLEFVGGRAQSIEELQLGTDLPAVAAACRRLHTARRFRDDFDMFAIQRRYLAVVEERGFRLPDGYLDFEPHVRAIGEAMLVHPEPTVPCNNDLLAENILVGDGGAVWLIDYEYSGNNEPSFELGNLWSECVLSLDQLEQLVAAYYGRPLAGKVARARLWGLMSKYGWTLWGAIQDGISELDFDFWAWGLERYERAVEEMTSPDFDRLLDEVRRTD